MKGEAQVFLTLAAAVLAPTPLSAQDSGMNRTLSPDSILARFEKGATTTGGAPGARDHAIAIDIQRGIEYGLARLAELDGVELCSFLRRVVQSGELSLLADGWRCRTAAS